jgi:ATP-dependent DNA ligase
VREENPDGGEDRQGAKALTPGAALAVASFVEPMQCLAVSKLPEGKEWQYELKLDGF